MSRALVLSSLFLVTRFLFAQGPAVQSDSGAYIEERKPTSATRAAQMTVRGNVLSTQDYFEKNKERGINLKLATESGEGTEGLIPKFDWTSS